MGFGLGFGFGLGLHRCICSTEGFLGSVATGIRATRIMLGHGDAQFTLATMPTLPAQPEQISSGWPAA